MHANLSDRDLSRVDLSCSWLLFANLAGAVLADADLSDANLQSANLSRVEANNAIFTGAKLAHADASHAKCVNASLGSAYLHSACLDHADLRGASFDGAECVLASFRYSLLIGARLTRLNLCDADLYGANLTDAFLGLTIFAATCLAEAQGLDKCRHQSYCTVDHRTIQKSPLLPRSFLANCEIPNDLIEFWMARFQYFSCFISYSHHDRHIAHSLQQALEKLGVRCWRDEHEILPGDDVLDAIDQGINLWDKVLLLCSRHSLESGWVNREIDKALKKEEALWKTKGTKTLALIPLNLDDYLFQWTSSRASFLTDRHAEDLTDWQDTPEKFAHAVGRIEKALIAGPSAPSLPPEPKL